jgi:predicted alpha/beta-hydrolase family hydrolase
MTGSAAEATELRIEPEGTDPVSAVLLRPTHAAAMLVLGHGAGAGMRHAFMETLAGRLAAAAVATLRYQFPYMEAGGRRPDPRKRLLATARAAVETGVELAGGLPVIAGGKSMGGRMTSLAAAEAPLPGVRGVVFVGFPLHGVGQTPSIERAAHLKRVDVPLLFLQGTRDKLADLQMLRPVVDDLDAATLHVIEDADHGFHVLKRTGRTDEEVIDELAVTIARWAEGLERT